MATMRVEDPVELPLAGVARGLPPEPRLPAFAQTLAWTLAPGWLMDRCVQRIGSSFTIRFAPSGMRLVLICDPDDVKRLFTASPELAPSGAGTSPIAAVLGSSSVLTLTGPEHMRQRKLLLPPFHGERMREYESVIVSATRKDMAGWELGRPMRLHPHTRDITLEVILRAVFGLQAAQMSSVKAAIAALTEPIGPSTMLRMIMRRPGGGRPSGALGRALAGLDEVIHGQIERGRAGGGLEGRTDILSLLLQARDEEGEPLNDGELRDELVTLLLAGHETTATSVAWAIERLVRHPGKLARLQSELDAGEEAYLQAVCEETLRVRPVVPVVSRVLTDEMELAGRVLPAGTRVLPSIYLVNRNPAVYEAPEEFRPERFLGERGPETFSWIPFGGGIRRCIGAAFAMQEMRVMLRTMLSEMTPALPTRGVRWPRGEPVRRRAVTLVPLAGARVVWRARGG